ncbi:MAG: hypothetical protein KGH53_01425 [Candidatus Micrarchaeota archaeon]|nr:hypothetical protein [Candidatus Micrarchaeota archaeon]
MITGLKINHVEATRETEDMISNMKFNINFDDLKVEGGEAVHVTFTFVANYDGEPGKGKDVGMLKIVGVVMSKETRKDADEIMNVWKTKKTLPLKFAEDVINLLNFECGARGTLLASSIGLLAPLPLSRAKLSEQPGKSA